MPDARVGADWNRCPFCGGSYLLHISHHPGCLLVRYPDKFCRWCGSSRGRQHIADGCPALTHLFPISFPQLDAHTRCTDCKEVFAEGSSFVIGISGVLCLGCGWEESA
jgi:hypothetical protein